MMCQYFITCAFALLMINALVINRYQEVKNDGKVLVNSSQHLAYRKLKMIDSHTCKQCWLPSAHSVSLVGLCPSSCIPYTHHGPMHTHTHIHCPHTLVCSVLTHSNVSGCKVKSSVPGQSCQFFPSFAVPGFCSFIKINLGVFSCVNMNSAPLENRTLVMIEQQSGEWYCCASRFILQLSIQAVLITVDAPQYRKLKFLKFV